MAIDESQRNAWLEKQQNNARFTAFDNPLKGGSGDGTFDGMEPRIATLEADMKHVKEGLARLADMPSDLATLKERTSHLPTKDEVKTEVKSAVDSSASRLAWILGLVIALATLINLASSWAHVAIGNHS